MRVGSRVVFKEHVYEAPHAPHYDAYKNHTFYIDRFHTMDSLQQLVWLDCISDPLVVVDGYVNLCDLEIAYKGTHLSHCFTGKASDDDDGEYNHSCKYGDDDECPAREVYLERNKQKHIIVWKFYDAPEELRKLSDNGGDEDWLAIVPNDMIQGGEAPWWMMTNPFSVSGDPQIVPHPTDKYCTIVIASHA